MTLPTFLLHDQEQRAVFVRAKGTFLAVRKSDAYVIYLFAIDTFYAEVWYRRTDQKIEMVRAFRSVTLLEPYLERATIADLIQN